MFVIVFQAQTTISPKEIHSINFNPSCPYDLAFHLDDGWYVKNGVCLSAQTNGNFLYYFSFFKNLQVEASSCLLNYHLSLFLADMVCCISVATGLAFLMLLT